MNKKEIMERAEFMRKQAWEVIRDTDVVNLWSSIGAEVNLVGSLKTGLLINNPDIDFHIYTDPFKLRESFSVMAGLAENRRIKRISYANLVEAEDRCIEWHAFYENDNGCIWQLDMIHILPDSPFKGYFEKVAERINAALCKETRHAILAIKDSLSSEKNAPSIQIYQAVIEGGVRNAEEFLLWQAENQEEGIITWMP